MVKHNSLAALISKALGILVVMIATLAIYSVTTLAVDYIGVGTVTGSIVNIRTEPSTQGDILGQAIQGNTYNVIDYNNNWYKVELSDATGWIVGDYISVTDRTADNSRGVITGSAVNVRQGPGTSYGVLGLAYSGQVYPIVGAENGWTKIEFNGTRGWVSGDYIKADRDNGSSRSTDRPSSAGAAVVAEAKKYLGKPYVYGASGPNAFDCSGFTSYVYKQLGYSLNRTAAGQNSNGVAVSKSDMQPGDLITFRNSSNSGIGHVAIYIGDGKMIHAGNSSTGVYISAVNSSYYGPRFVSARRIVR